MSNIDISNEAIGLYDWDLMKEQDSDIAEAVEEVLAHALTKATDEVEGLSKAFADEIRWAPAPNWEEDNYDAGYVAGLDKALDMVKDLIREMDGRKLK